VLFALAQSLLGSRAFFDRLWQRRAQLDAVDLHLVWGTRDSAFPPSMLERWQRTFPHARVTRLDEAGHWPHEEAPVAVARALAAVLTAPTRVL
jgi:pimeloyl-ACP methyl ester carboxylesterase